MHSVRLKNAAQLGTSVSLYATTWQQLKFQANNNIDLIELGDLSRVLKDFAPLKWLFSPYIARETYLMHINH